MNLFSLPSPKYSLVKLPSRVYGLTKWDPNAFNVSLQVPYITLQPQMISAVAKVLKRYTLKLPHICCIRPATDPPKRELLLHPDYIQTFDDFDANHQEMLRKNCQIDSVQSCNLELTLKNWRPLDLLKAVTEDVDKNIPCLSSYSVIGHIIHVNLKQHHLPKKEIIGHILLNSVSPQIRTVINKNTGIDNKFRNFQHEILAGEDDFMVTVKESGCQFQMDFSQVYWNPRLSTEHERIIDKLHKGDTLFDCFAGVGPFAVPTGKKGIQVWANDLNPESYKWLVNNVKLNKVAERVQCFNMDGRDFIRQKLPKVIANKGPEGKIYVTMNLPALAIEFLDAFREAFESIQSNETIYIEVYSFSEATDQEKDVMSRCLVALGLEDAQDELKPPMKTSFVRNVAPKKDMFRISFPLSKSCFESTSAKRLKTCQES
ncbi:hypothetical protein TCAL_00142 [Tigriopus californicus]|uniref:tRNA (guanine(37)-N1)-methyltransferase n=1 Tax=Tigriopus californicus TaxID=6832 RepID=A0A553PGZ1_TIGCA|nr:tRNA (guanine(37)-N1)-methyltransferase-like [Tigriopus californicus]TRY76937.1 hypothetical protein TCAL_00142 [Tigriopus californicus]|eukprot:TCALIF_00142-PA protein Name:"Similar to trmt5 tRNA (guanine(37)-N1)-methyltransferase (Danio rerio)" AED:0.01 eAED:0.01 QI:0/-1/0/1/-1/1/1/0/429